MTRDVVSLGEDADVARAARVMMDGQVRHVPVVRGGDVVGVISRRDLLKALARDDGDIGAEVERLLRAEPLMLGDLEVEVCDGHVTLAGAVDGVGKQLARALAGAVPGVVAVRFADEPAASGGPDARA